MEEAYYMSFNYGVRKRLDLLNRQEMDKDLKRPRLRRPSPGEEFLDLGLVNGGRFARKNDAHGGRIRRLGGGGFLLVQIDA